jgi:MFS transporter, PHS family, inorganic phosphate transporter
VRTAIDEDDMFPWEVLLVASSGLFTTAYSIFSTNITIPALEAEYDACNSNYGLAVNLTTIVGIIVGQVAFGILADIKGRKFVVSSSILTPDKNSENQLTKAQYGVELLIVILATFGMMTSSSGHGDWMNVFAWVSFWRFWLGIGLGAEVGLDPYKIRS